MYHWSEHGSKKATDLMSYNLPRSWQQMTTTPQVICHDQEPLNFNNVKDSWNKEYSNWLEQQEPNRQPLYQNKEIKDYLRPYHLRSLIDFNFGVTVYDACVLVHSEQNSKDLELYKDNGFIPVYYWSHAIIARDWFRYAAVDPTIGQKQNITHTFLIYNRAWSGTREYRLKFAEQLVNCNLVNASKTAFSAVDDDGYYANHTVSNSDFKIERYDLESMFNKNNSPSWASAEYSADDYNLTLCEVVLETIFDDPRIHVTEKVLRPIACQQPFIVLAGPRTLEYLRNYGFRTFDGIINESYDTIDNSRQRMDTVIKEMQRISAFTDQERLDFIEKTREICEHNRRWFFSEDFFNLIVDEFKKNLDKGLTEIENYKTGNMWFGLRELARTKFPNLYTSAMRQGNEDWVRSQLRSSVPSQSGGNSESLRP